MRKYRIKVERGDNGLLYIPQKRHWLFFWRDLSGPWSSANMAIFNIRMVDPTAGFQYIGESDVEYYLVIG
jgi:hypothetical protein